MWRREYCVSLPRAKQGQRVDTGKTACGFVFSYLSSGHQSMAASLQRVGPVWGTGRRLCSHHPTGTGAGTETTG